MSLTINTNIEAVDANRNLNNTQNALATSMERLSSGLRINSAADDVAGYAIDQQLQSQISGLEQAEQNSQDAVALAQTAQGALNTVEQMLQRIRQLAVQYENGTNTETNKESISEETKQLYSEIERDGETASFGGIKLLEKSESIVFQVGADGGESEQIKVETFELSSKVEEVKLGEGAIEEIEEQIEAVSKAAGEFGSVQDRLQYTEANISTSVQNLTAAQSSIIDVNMASEVSNMTKDQILQQAGVAVLTQANSLPQAVLHLLGE